MKQPAAQAVDLIPITPGQSTLMQLPQEPPRSDFKIQRPNHSIRPLLFAHAILTLSDRSGILARQR
ncbi:MAG: hypothetical protein HQM15_02260 [Deltaproteobacteria bacterium]|nr:hypothetical protein [Deltaproteobacteria bacterium]